MKLRILSVIALLAAAPVADAYHTTQPTPNLQDTHVSAHAVYVPATHSYTISYAITSGAANTGEIDHVSVDISSGQGGFDRIFYTGPSPGSVNFVLDRLDAKGKHIIPVSMTAPSGWRTSAVNLDMTAHWGTSLKNVTSVSGLTITAGFPPVIRTMAVQPRARFYLDTDGEEGDPAIAALEKAYYAGLTYTTWTLGPGSPTGSQYGDWDVFRDNLNKAIQIGWIPDTTLANNLVTQLAKARTDFEAGHDTAAKQDLNALLVTIAASTDSQRRSEVADLVNIYANEIINNTPDDPAAPIPFDPALRLSPPAATLPLGQTYTLTATVINVGNGDAPLPGFDLNFTVTDGPDAGLQSSAQTDSNGQAVFSFVGNSLGTDKITVASPAVQPVRRDSAIQIAAATDDIAPFIVAVTYPPSPSISAQAQVIWSGGPDLVVPLFSPPYIESQGGATIKIQDVTANQGTTDASASVTRYYLSTAQPPFDLTTAIVIGERPVPALPAGAKSNSGLQPFVLPSTLAAGQYFLAACADDNNAVAELDETNNCSWSQLKTGNAVVVPVKQLNPSPDCSKAQANPTLLWPPNHKLATISITGVKDPDGEPVTIKVTKITQDEPVNGLGDGDTSPDGFGIGQPQAQVRAERSGLGNGRVYAITFTATDPAGGTCSATVNVGVPHDQGKGSTPIDDGQKYDSTLP
jgi:hypothetical protein